MSISAPLKVLHEAQGHIISLELINGEMFRGRLKHSEVMLIYFLCFNILTHTCFDCNFYRKI